MKWSLVLSLTTLTGLTFAKGQDAADDKFTVSRRNENVSTTFYVEYTKRDLAIRAKAGHIHLRESNVIMVMSWKPLTSGLWKQPRIICQDPPNFGLYYRWTSG